MEKQMVQCEDGRRRQARIIGGKMYDCILMDMLAQEFEPGYVGRLMAQLEI